MPNKVEQDIETRGAIWLTTAVTLLFTMILAIWGPVMVKGQLIFWLSMNALISGASSYLRNSAGWTYVKIFLVYAVLNAIIAFGVIVLM